MEYKIRGMPVRKMYLRPSQLSAPVIGSGVGRTWQEMQVGWKVPDGMTYELPSYTNSDPLDRDRTLAYPSIAAGELLGLSFYGTAAAGISFFDGVSFYGGLSSGGVDYRGTMPSWPIIRVQGPATTPSFTIGTNLVSRATLTFTGLTLADTEVLVVDLANRTAIKTGSGQVVTDVRRYLAPPAPWRSWYLQPGGPTANVVRFSYTSGGAPTNSTISYRTAMV